MARAKMPSMNIVFFVALIALALAAELVLAQAEGSAPAPAPSADCTTVLSNLISCLDYISANDTKPPPKDCCSGLVQVVKDDEICLCQLFVRPNPFGLTINETRAAAMPTVCKVGTPPLSTCSALGIPVSAPASSAASPTSSAASPSSSAASPSSSAASSPGGSAAGSAGTETTPTASPTSSGTAGNFVPSVGLFAALVFAAFAV